MKKIIVIMLALIMACCTLGCGNNADNNTDKNNPSTDITDTNDPNEQPGDDKKPDDEKPNEQPAADVMQAMRDPDFKIGFNLLGTNAAVDGVGVKSTVKFGRNNPIWELAQWYTRYDLNKVAPIITSQKMTIKDASKTVELDRVENKLTLALDTTKEYDTMETSRIFWPHLLVEQTFTDFSQKYLSEFSELRTTIDFSVTKAIKGDIETRPTFETLPAQFQQFYYINDYKNDAFMWFGLSFLDTRFAKTNLTALQDFAGGTAGNFIYCLGADELMDGENFTIGKEYKIDLDILPHISKAISKAKEMGFMPKTELSDCRVTGMNLGWELPGAWDVSATMSNISLSGKLK